MSGETTNTVYTYRDCMWQEVLPPMPTPRCLLSAASYNNELVIAAGGVVEVTSTGKSTRTDRVEIYQKNASCWFNTKRLPFSLSQLAIQWIGDTCYTVGGIADSFDHSSSALYATVTSLLENAVPVDSRYDAPKIKHTWKMLRNKHPLTFPCLVELDRKLVVMGGSVDWERRRGSKFISTYDFTNSIWIESKGAQLPLALYRPGLVNLGNNKVMLIGGQPRSQQFSKMVFIGQSQN